MRDLVNRRSTKNRNDFYFYFFLLFYGAVIIYLAHKIPIWEDEAYSLNTSSHDLATVINQSYNFEGQPPGYFLILALWRKIDSGIFFARMFSVLFIGLSGIYFYRIVRLSEGIKFSRWMLIIFLLNPFTVWAALEIRLYAFVIFLSTALIYNFLIFYKQGSKKSLYLFLSFSFIGIYAHYFFVIQIIALAFSMLILKGWSSFFYISKCLFPVAILFIPNLLFMGHQIDIAQRDVLNGSKFDEIRTIIKSPQNLLLSVSLFKTVVISRIIRIIFAIIIFYSLWLLYKTNDKKKSDIKKFAIIFINLSISILLLGVIVSISGIGFQKKYMAFLFPFLMMIFMLYKEYSFPVRKILFFLTAIYFIFVLFLIYNNPLKSYDYKKTTNYVTSIEKANEPIFLYSKILFPAFSYYYKGKNSVASLPKAQYDGKYYEKNISDTIELKKALASKRLPTKSFILITGQIIGFKYPVNLDEKLIDLYISNNFKVTIDTSFIGDLPIHTLRVRRIEVKQ